METIKLNIRGMTCQGCVNSITRVLEALDGVKSVFVDLEMACVKVTYDSQKANKETIISTIEDAGYDVCSPIL